MELVVAGALSFCLDLLLGDPGWIPHPVVWMGRAISGLEERLRRIFPKTARGEWAAGALLAILLPAGTLALTLSVLWFAGQIHPGLRFFLEVFWGWQALAVRGLGKESSRVYRALREGTLEQAQQAVARIVGRDTQRLDRAGVTRAAVETVAENFSDGVAAPLFYFFLGGAPLALCYKAINTMDSMVGYRNERYLYFGRWAARLDDGANWLPAVCRRCCWWRRLGSWGRMGEVPGGSGAGTGATTPAPTQRKQRRRWPERWGFSWPDQLGILGYGWKNRPLESISARLYQRIFCAVTGCSMGAASFALAF